MGRVVMFGQLSRAEAIAAPATVISRVLRVRYQPGASNVGAEGFDQGCRFFIGPAPVPNAALSPPSAHLIFGKLRRIDDRAGFYSHPDGSGHHLRCG